MRPKPRFFMSGKAARTSMSGARTKIAMKPSQISGVSSSIPGARASASGRTLLMPMPALLMTASIAPKRARAVATAAAQPFASARSARMGWRRSLVSAWRAESRSSALGSRSTAATRWPAANSASVIATPIPPAAPVRKTTRLPADVMIVSAPKVRSILAEYADCRVWWVGAEGGQMSGLKIYGVARTRAFRALWVAEELGLAYEHVPIEIGEAGARKPEFLALNPNGRLPIIVDGDFVLPESLAITLYPAALEDEARLWQWSFWAVAEVDRGVNIWSLHAVRLPPNERDAALRNEALGVLAAPFAVLDAAVSKNPYLLGPEFTVADLNVAAVLSRAVDMDLSAWPHLKNWLVRCLERPAARRALALKTKSDQETPAETTRRIARINRL